MPFNPREIIRSDLGQLGPYIPIEPYDVLSEKLGFSPNQIIKLDANENPYGPSPLAQEALANLAYPHIYPDPENHALREALSRYLNLDPSQIMPGSGADELIDLITRVTLNPGDGVLICPPTFGMYEFDVRVNAGKIFEIPRNPDFSLDMTAIERAVAANKPKLLFLGSPNNPDGTLIPKSHLEYLLQLPVLVVVDEAYIEFCGMGRLGDLATILPIQEAHNNLIILRTFSKWAGLAGLRVGYGIFPEWMMEILWKAKQPYNVNVAASVAAIASLQDLNHLESNVHRIIAERARLMNNLSGFIHIRPFPSHANFILCRVFDYKASELKHVLASKYGILIRYFDKPGLRNMIRITVGKPDQSDKLLLALYEILDEERT
jgi:histidinol-phosphate aminotransferase